MWDRVVELVAAAEHRTVGVERRVVTGKFVKVPSIWRDTLADIRADSSTYRVALYLLDRAVWTEHVPLGNRVLEKHGISRRSKWRALGRLRQERFGGG